MGSYTSSGDGGIFTPSRIGYSFEGYSPPLQFWNFQSYKGWAIMKIDTNNGDDENNINIDERKKNGDVKMPNGDSRIRNAILIVAGAICIILFLKYGAGDKLSKAGDWVSEHSIHLIEVIVGMILVFAGGNFVMRYRRFDKQVASIAIIIIGVFIIAFGLFGLGLTP